MRKILILLFSLVCGMQNAQAVLRVEITRGVEGAAPIAVIPFDNRGAVPLDIADVVASDLQRSGKFAPIERDKLIARPKALDDVNYKLWRVASIDHLVIGQATFFNPQNIEIEFRLVDVFKGRQVLGYKFNATSKNIRGFAHRISDLIYKQITGEPGAFDTRIAYVTAERRVGAQPQYKLQVADTDGYNPHTVLTSPQPLMSPSWSPDGSQLVYVSFEDRRSAIYSQNVFTGERKKITEFKGINGAPVWSPDGRQLALTLSLKGNPDIYLFDLGTRKLKQLTRHWSIDTEPAWMPDGRSLVFTSSRAGNPQLYQISINGGEAKRLSFEGKYNANAEVSPDGNRVAYVTGEGNVFKIAILDLSTGYTQILTDGLLDESPSFAPNGSMILYTAQEKDRSVLAAVSVDGRFKQKLVLSEGDVREPAWAPFRQQ